MAVVAIDTALREMTGNLSKDSLKCCKASFNASLWIDFQSSQGAQLPGYCAPQPLRIRDIPTDTSRVRSRPRYEPKLGQDRPTDGPNRAKAATSPPRLLFFLFLSISVFIGLIIVTHLGPGIVRSVIALSQKSKAIWRLSAPQSNSNV